MRDDGLLARVGFQPRGANGAPAQMIDPSAWKALLSYPVPLGLAGSLIGVAAAAAFWLARLRYADRSAIGRPVAPRTDVTGPGSNGSATVAAMPAESPADVPALATDVLRRRALQLASALTGLQQSWNLACSAGWRSRPVSSDQQSDTVGTQHEDDLRRLRSDVRLSYRSLKPQVIAVREELKRRSLPLVVEQREPSLDDAYESPEDRLAPAHWVYNALAADLNYLAGSLPSASPD